MFSVLYTKCSKNLQRKYSALKHPVSTLNQLISSWLQKLKFTKHSLQKPNKTQSQQRTSHHLEDIRSKKLSLSESRLSASLNSQDGPPESVLFPLGSGEDPGLLLWQCEQCKHTLQLPSFLARIERNFSAGPSFMFMVLVRCSSVSIGRPAPSMRWSRKVWKRRENLVIDRFV